MNIIIEILLVITVICCCIFAMKTSSEERASPDLQNLRATLAEGGRQSVEMEATRCEKIKSKIFYRELKEGESVRSMRLLTKSARDIIDPANNNRKDSSRSSLSRSIRAAAETSIKQFRKPECTICLSEFEAGEMLCWAKTDQCNHVFHFACIGEWLKDHDECPMCLADIVNAVDIVVEESGKKTGNENASGNKNTDLEATGNDNTTGGKNNRTRC
jgi:hypothetical protein